MSSVFSGMSGVITATLGRAGISYQPAGGVPRDIPSIFREGPIEAVDTDGHPVMIVAPTWRVRRHLVPEIARGDRLDPGNGKIYSILTHDPSGSPAEDAFLICELERIYA